ncbi:MAG: bifunctional 5,10-methylene-tetrahydrofolate dehydrogenase/5,10-methylene-tetrahydrofolate cyclohydrolase [Parcubacteria group bacterium]|nr:MAG: bifunctional 5,10-methylene-tetrahydrofolate dehydrogenase/5,10-methylene-tetrahydrofolate cyclohydrolase [Parcubacteria group bacterium]
MPKIIDGKALAEEIQAELTKEITAKKLNPNLAVVLVGNDPASRLYVGLKKKACQKIGIAFHEYLLAADSSETKVLETINFLNNDSEIDAILVQLPLPAGLDTDKIVSAIDPTKDVDGFHAKNIEKFLAQQTDFIPGLPLGIIKLIKSTGENLNGKKAVIVAKSQILYRPLAKLLNDQDVVTEIVSPTEKSLKDKTLTADILITAIGKAFAITEEMVKDGAIVIDVGTNKIDDKYTVGDVDYSGVFEKVSHITPVPGGVGPMTVAMLLYNTVKLAERNKK